MYLLVSLLQLNALVVGNGSYILWPCGHDLHGLTVEIEGDGCVPAVVEIQGGGGQGVVAIMS